MSLWVSPQELSNPNSPYARDAAESASYILWALSGRKFTEPRTVVEVYECPEKFLPGVPRPVLVGGQVYNICGGCGYPLEIRLRNRPAWKIESVSVRGVEVDSSTYELVNRAVLRPKYGRTWDICQGIKVRYRYGQPPPEAGRRAARFLANQLLCAWSGGSDCKLPSRVTSLSRQGVSMTILDTQDFLDQGKTGLYEVDLFLRAANPTKSAKRARVFSPDQPRVARLAESDVVPEPDDIVIVPGEVLTRDFLNVDLDGPTLDGVTWKPRAQISVAPNDTAVVFDDTYWSYITGGVRLTVSDVNTMWDSVTNGTFDLYAVRVDDESVSSLIFSSNVFVTALVS